MRTQIILDETTHKAVRSLAFHLHQSMSKIIRDILHQNLRINPSHRSIPKKFSFVGSAASQKKNKTSEKHDHILGY